MYGGDPYYHGYPPGFVKTKREKSQDDSYIGAEEGYAGNAYGRADMLPPPESPNQLEDIDETGEMHALTDRLPSQRPITAHPIPAQYPYRYKKKVLIGQNKNRLP